MGACLGKHRKKRNTVCPSNKEDDIHKRKHKAPEDMIKDLKEANAEDSKMAKAGVSFTVDFRDGDPARMPSRLADRLNGAITPDDDNEVKYSSEEKQILAELLRNDIMRERREKAAKSSGGQHI